jgi:hypothetical protein
MDMARVEIRIGSQTYTGKSHKAATESALAHLAALFPDVTRDVWAPAIVPVAGHVGVAYKGPAGTWEYVIRWPDGRDGAVSGGNWTRQEAEFRQRRHLAQAIYRAPDGPIDSPDADGESLAVIHPGDNEGLASHRQWLRFQREYRAAVAEGLQDSAAHQRACERSSGGSV